MDVNRYLGRRFEGRYEVLNLLGEGGMGAVFRALDHNLKREVALKLLREDYSSRPELRQRFLQEAEVAARLEHPGIVPVYHIGGDGNLLYLVMELIPGGNLADLMNSLRRKRQWISMNEALQIVRQVALALQYAHDRNILHRDIKPANIMLRNRSIEGLDYQPVVADFGLAKLLDQNASLQHPLMGTPNYMSPEQVLAQETDGRSDIYSLGLVLYELLVGRLPFQITTFPEAMRYHVREPITPPSRLRPGLPPQLEELVLRAVAKNVEERYQTARELAEHISALGPLEEQSPPPHAHSLIGLAQEWQRSIIDQMNSQHPEGSLPSSQLRGPGLHVRLPDGQFRVVELRPVMYIGREDGNDLVLEDTQVSRRHAVLRQEANGYTITDLKSTNGVYLNRKKLAPNRPYPFTPQDDLRLGNTRIRLLLGGEGGRPFDAALPKGSLRGRPGQAVSIPVEITNVDQERDVQIEVSVIGADPGWLRPLRPVHLPPGRQETVTVQLDLPAQLNGQPARNLILRLVDVLSGAELSLSAVLQVEGVTGRGSLPLAPPRALTSPSEEEVHTGWSERLPTWLYLVVGGVLVLLLAGGGYLAGRNFIGDAGAPAPATPTAAPSVTPPPSATPAPTDASTAPAAVAVVATETPTATATDAAPSSGPAILKPTSTPTPLVPPTSTPTPTRTQPPTSTPVPPTPTPTITPTPRPPTATPPPPGLITGFEAPEERWESSNSGWGTLTVSTETVKAGRRAAKLTYNVPGAEADQGGKSTSSVGFFTNIGVEGTPTQFTLWVYGDGSENYLNIWVQDAAGQTYQFTFGQLRHTGWQQMAAQIDPALPWPNGNLTIPGNTAKPRFPITVIALVLDAFPDGRDVAGEIYLDDLAATE